MDTDPIVITGIGGRYPESSNVDEFWSNLLSGHQLYTADDRRWPLGYMNLPRNTGKVPNIGRFDSEFFNFSNRDAHEMDAGFKLCHEVTFEAILDAGLDPQDIANSRTGMYIGYCYNDTWSTQTSDGSIYDCEWNETFSRVSNYFHFKGPCMTYDSACASSFSALNEAFHAIKAGVIDAAIVAGVTVCLKPSTASAFRILGMTSADGQSRCLDHGANGYVRSETVCSILIQRRSASRRVYGQILASKSNSDGYKKEGITFPGKDVMIRLMRETFDGVHPYLDPKDVKYIEAHVTSTQVGDPVECGAIESVFCPDGRKEALLIGCLKSNMGHAEGASGVAATTKACLIFQKGIIPPNIGYETPNLNIDGLFNGNLKPVLAPTKFDGKVIALNSFGFGGTNVHAIIESYDGQLNAGVQTLEGFKGINRLILFKGRTKKSFETLKMKIKSHPKDVTAEYLDLVNNIANIDDDKWKVPYRGYFIIDKISKRIIKSVWRRQKRRDAVSVKVGVQTSEQQLDPNNNQIKDLIQILSDANLNVTISNSMTVAATCTAIVSATSGRRTVQKSYDLRTADDCLSLIGDQFMNGVRNLTIKKLYPTIKYPVSGSTASTSSLISWNHDKEWTVYKAPEHFRFGTRNKTFHFDYSGPFHYLAGHQIDGRILFPASGYLWALWQSISLELVENTSVAYLKTKVKFSRVKLYQAIIVNEDLKDEISFKTCINSTNGRFEVTRQGTLLVDGFIFIDGVSTSLGVCSSSDGDGNDDDGHDGHDDGEKVIGKKDFYKELRARGYDYEDDFQGVEECNFNGTKGSVSFLNHWICFADAVFQLSIINDEARSLFLPTGFELIEVDGATFKDISSADYVTYLNFMSSDVLDADMIANGADNQLIADKIGDNLDNTPRRFEVKIRRETKEIFTNGFYVKGLNGVSTSRKVASPIVRSFNDWHPLDEVVDEDGDKIRLKNDYEEKCLNLLNDMKNSNFQTDANSGADGADNNYLLNFMQKLTDKDGAIINELSYEDKISLSKDMLLGVPVDNECFMHILSVIIDSIGPQKIQITEINMSYQPTLETDVTRMVTGLFLASEYEYYQSYHLDTGSSVNKLLNRRQNLDADLIIIQHSNLSFKFLYSKEERIENEEKFIDLNNFLNVQTNDGKFILLLSRRASFCVEAQLCQDAINDEDGDGTDKIIVDMERSGLTLICIKKVGFIDFLLFRNLKSNNDNETIPQTFEIEEALNFDWINNLRLKLKEENYQEKREPLFIICKDEPVHGMNGFINCVKDEDDKIHLLIVSDKTDAKTKEELKKKCFKLRLRTTIIKNGILGSNSYSENFNHGSKIKIRETPNRRQLIERPKDEHFCLNVKTKGDLSSLFYEKVKISDTSSTSGLIIRDGAEGKKKVVIIHFAPLNFKDIMVASGRVPSNAYPWSSMNGTKSELGMEFSGEIITEDGAPRRVMGILPSDTIATAVEMIDAYQSFTFDVPKDMSLEEASTIPVVYMTVYYALHMRGKLYPGESILIHAGSGGVGQAAINVCRSMGCEIFTTVGTVEKRRFIKSTFNISDDHIFDSRSVSFADDLLRATDGRGVDVILNSLSEDKLQAGLNCLAENGRFIEIGKYDFIADSYFDPSKLSLNQSFHSICLAYFFQKCRDYQESTGLTDPEADVLQNLMKKGLEDGTIKPLPRSIFNWNQAEEAFRFMASGKHIGKVVIKMKDARDEMMEMVTADKKMITNPDAVKICDERLSFDGHKSYLVIGGLGGMGLEVCQWLVNKGVRYLIVTSRRGVQNSYQDYCIKRMERTSFGCKIFVRTENVSVFENAEKVVNFCNNLAPIGGIFNLGMVLKDSLFIDHDKESFEEACSIKVRGSANLDTISRTSCPYLDYFVCFSSIASSFGNGGQSNYGFANSFMDNLCCQRRSEGLPGVSIAWGAVGDIGHVAEHIGKDIAVRGTGPQRINSCLEVLERSLNGHRSNITSYVFKDRTGQEVKGNLLASIFNVLGVKDTTKVDTKSTLSDLGIDSLMAVEIKQIIQKKYEKVLSTKEIRDLSVGAIKSMDADNLPSNASIVPRSIDVDTDIGALSTLSAVPTEIFEVLKNGSKSSENPIFIFPPLDGSFLDLQTLISELSAQFRDRPIVGVNWTRETFCFDTVQEVSKFYIQKLKEFYPKISTFDFISYSMGTIFSIEIAIQLQKEDSRKYQKKVRNLILLDGSPALVRKYYTKIVNTRDMKDRKTLSSIILEYYGSIEKVDLSAKVSKIPDDAEGIKKWLKVVQSIKGNKITDKDVIGAFDRIRIKSNMALNYHPKAKLDMDIHLIRSTDGLLDTSANEHDYDLHKIVSKNVSVLKLDGDHKTFLIENSSKIASTIKNIFINNN